MSELSPLIINLDLILIAASIITLIFKKLKQPLILGYLVTGFIIGPYFSWFPTITDKADIQIWADIGVIFLLFALGLEFSFKKLIKAGGSALITTTIEVISMFLIGYSCGHFMGWSHFNNIFLGGMLSMSSTTIIIKAFEDLKLKTQKFTTIVFSILIVEDIFAIFMMVLFSTIIGNNNEAGLKIIESILKLLFLLSLWFIMGIFLIPTFLKKIRLLINDETLLIVSIGLCLSMVILTEYSGYSSALGSFIMGSILSETIDAEKIEELIKPVKDLFGAIFFVSVGMLIDPIIISKYFVSIVVITIFTIVGKLLFSSLGVLLSGQSLKIAIQSGFSLAQIGEFAFIIAGLGQKLGVTDSFLYPIIITVSVITTFLTPFIIKLSNPIYNILNKLLPIKIKIILDKYSEGSQTVNKNNDWKSFLKTNTIIIVIYSIILIGILIFIPLIYPIINSHFGNIGDIISLIITLVLMSPFINALLFSKLKTKSFKNLWNDKKFSRGPIVSILLIRCLLALIFVSISISKFSILASLGILPTLAIITIIVLSKKLYNQYLKTEERFIFNFNEKEYYKKKLLPNDNITKKLMEKDIHFETFSISSEYKNIGFKLKELHFREKFGVNIVSIIRGIHRINIPGGNECIYPLDKIIVIGNDKQLSLFKIEIESKIPIEQKNLYNDESKEVILQQFVIEANSSLLNSSISSSCIRDKNQCLVVGIEKDGFPLLTLDITYKFKKGDVIWVVGEKQKINELVNGTNNKSYLIKQ